MHRGQVEAEGLAVDRQGDFVLGGHVGSLDDPAVVVPVRVPVPLVVLPLPENLQNNLKSVISSIFQRIYAILCSFLHMSIFD